MLSFGGASGTFFQWRHKPSLDRGHNTKPFKICQRKDGSLRSESFRLAEGFWV